jgi:hypothetical protein
MIFKLKSLFSQLGLESPHGKQVAHSVALRGIKGWSTWLFHFQICPSCSSMFEPVNCEQSLSPYLYYISFHLGLGASGRLLWVESVWKTHVWLKLGDLTGRGLLHRQLAEISSGCGISFVSRFAVSDFFSHEIHAKKWFICCCSPPRRRVKPSPIPEALPEKIPEGEVPQWGKNHSTISDTFFKGKTEDQPMAPLVELHFGNHGNDRPRLSGKSCGGMSGSAISISMLDQWYWDLEACRPDVLYDLYIIIQFYSLYIYIDDHIVVHCMIHRYTILHHAIG